MNYVGLIDKDMDISRYSPIYIAILKCRFIQVRCGSVALLLNLSEIDASHMVLSNQLLYRCRHDVIVAQYFVSGYINFHTEDSAEIARMFYPNKKFVL